MGHIHLQHFQLSNESSETGTQITISEGKAGAAEMSLIKTKSNIGAGSITRRIWVRWASGKLGDQISNQLKRMEGVQAGKEKLFPFGAGSYNIDKNENRTTVVCSSCWRLSKEKTLKFKKNLICHIEKHFDKFKHLLLSLLANIQKCWRGGVFQKFTKARNPYNVPSSKTDFAPLGPLNL